MISREHPEAGLSGTDYAPNADGIFVPDVPIEHRDEEYDPRGFDVLWEMQVRHFWYRGWHRFLLHATKRALRDFCSSRSSLDVIDLGGGCGGWVKYLVDRKPAAVTEIALADSSLLALQRAGTLLPASVKRYQVDLLNLRWQARWDAAFVLDVLEHLDDDEAALREITAALKPGGLLFVTMPALQFFWSYNDEMGHRRRYNRQDLVKLADAAGLRLLSSRYFMFFLSPLLWMSRSRPGIAKLTHDQKLKLAVRAHRLPIAPVNEALAAMFGMETPLGHWIKLPWGTSIFGLFLKPDKS
jgi:SAM-dependent methyltransferase